MFQYALSQVKLYKRALSMHFTTIFVFGSLEAETSEWID
jgi:hypothetical protein